MHFIDHQGIQEGAKSVGGKTITACPPNTRFEGSKFRCVKFAICSADGKSEWVRTLYNCTFTQQNVRQIAITSIEPHFCEQHVYGASGWTWSFWIGTGLLVIQLRRK